MARPRNKFYFHILDLLNSGTPVCDIARRFSVSEFTVRSILNKEHPTRDKSKNRNHPSRLEFTPEYLEALHHAKCKQVASDKIVPGLRVHVTRLGTINFFVQYHVGVGPRLSLHRGWLKIGDYPSMPIEKARQIATSILKIAERWIDPVVEVENRFIREILSQGENWRP